MKHFGDIAKLSGYDLPIVDVITGGSPCQDLSVAGNRQGLAGERSGLFMEQIRIVKEMREHDRSNGRPVEYIRPRYMVWENVPGALSSGKPKGADFQIVLTEIVKIANPEAPDVPLPENGRWTKSGCIYDNLGGGGQLLGDYMTHSFGESPREENESHLSQILEDSAPQKYFLSERAVIGILNRAERRGKELPKILKQALLNQINQAQQP